jgi:hypothetical protein
MSQIEINTTRQRIAQIDDELNELPYTATTQVDKLVMERMRLQSKLQKTFGV